MTDSQNNQSVGVLGVNNGGDSQGVGVKGVSSSDQWGASGVFGLASSTSGRAAGVWGTTRSPNGFGVISIGNAFIRGDVRVTGRKHAVVETSQGARAVHCEESPEAWFSDYGFGRVAAGEEVATIEIDPLFAETVNLDQPYHVFVQAYGRTNLFVRARSATGFEVYRCDGDAVDEAVEFSYRIVAKRLGYEGERLEEVSIPEPPHHGDIDIDAMTPPRPGDGHEPDSDLETTDRAR